MSKLQEACKPVLIPFILGKRLSLLSEDQARLISQWAVMTTFSIDLADRPSSVIPDEIRFAFAKDRVVTDHWHVWIGSNPTSISGGYSHHGFLDIEKVQGCGKLTGSCSNTIAMGKLLLVTVFNTGMINISDTAMDSLNMFKLFSRFSGKVNFCKEEVPRYIDLRDLDYYSVGLKV
jgi:hypothetical protein